jgi:lysophospholipase L1-like esterase
MRLPSPPKPSSLRGLARLALLGAAFSAAALAPATLVAQVRVFNNGDSITFGIGASTPATRSYSPVLAGLLGNGYTVQRDGTGGATLLRRGQPSFFDTQGIQNTQQANPDVITVFLGTNDSKPGNWTYRDEFVADYVSLIDTFRALPANPRIFLCLPPPANAPSQNDVRGSVVANEVLPRILEAARARDVSVIDLHTPFLDNFRARLVDGIHPNDDGHRVIAEQMRDAIVEGRHLRPVPGSWQRAAVGGSGAFAGSDAQESAGGALVLYAGGGASVANGADAFRLLHQAVDGDAEVTARVTTLRAADPLTETRNEAVAGVTLREGLAPDARHISLLSTPGGVSLRWREGSGANTGVTTLTGVRAPVWLRLRRTGNSFTATYSTNGNDWRPVGTPRTLALAQTTQAGVLAASGQNEALVRARFEQVNVEDLTNSNPPPPPPNSSQGRPLGARSPWASEPGSPSFRGDREATSR